MFFLHFVQALAKSNRQQMRELFKDVDFLCATSDIWSRSNKSFIAVSVHFFSPNSFDLQTKFIACEYFPGQHTNDRVAHKLNSIFDGYDILKKVFFITTDGAGEYTAALKYYGNNYQSIRLHHSEEDNLDWLHNVGASGRSFANHGSNSNSDQENANENVTTDSCLDSDIDDDENDDDIFINVDNDEINNNLNQSPTAAAAAVTDATTTTAREESHSFHIEELPELLLENMNRIDCSAHKLDKLGKIDALNAKNNDPDYSDLYDRAFSKLEAIWSLKESRLNAELFTKITGKKLIGPHRIRWLKTCDAVSLVYFCFYS